MSRAFALAPTLQLFNESLFDVMLLFWSRVFVLFSFFFFVLTIIGTNVCKKRTWHLNNGSAPIQGRGKGKMESEK